MITLFRRLLIRFGKVIPFIFAAIVSFGYIELGHAIYTNSVIDIETDYIAYYTPISDAIGNVVYIDLLDVLLLYVLAIALEFCKYNLRAVHYLALNLAVRFVVESVSLDAWALIPLCAFMAILGLYCVYGGFKMIPHQKDRF